MKTVTIYTDGACSGNPGPGGWGAILEWNGREKELSGGEANTTNNRMELTGVIRALSMLKERCIVELYSDSKYVIDALEKGWVYGWKKKGKHLWYTGRKESTIWEFDKPKKNGDHPTMKPIPLLAYPIMNSSLTNSLVLDPFGGSGSTLIACEQTDRICYTIELDEKFCDVIVKRYIEQVGTADGVSVQRDGLTYQFSELEVQNA